MSKSKQKDEAYWEEYDGLQYAKHQLLRSYLGGWFPILSSWQGKVLYIDCHAGRGRHTSGFDGSPILAMNILLDHGSRPRILSSTEVHFIFFELNDVNHQYLNEEIKNLGALPKNIKVNSIQGDYENELRQIIDGIKLRRTKLAPSFAFVDPYGFKLSMRLLNDIVAFSQSELLINFMFRYIDMAIRHENQSSNMDALFGTDRWKGLKDIANVDDRSAATIALFSENLNAKYITTMRMHGKNGALKYVLIHATNHSKGRQLMKDSIWKVVPDGSFTASEKNSANQMVLIQPKPNLAPLQDMLLTHFEGKEVAMKVIYAWLLGEIYRKPHLHKVVRELLGKDQIIAKGYTGKFAFNKNPIICFPTMK